MPDTAPNAELLRSLARLARGLSALFWALPAALIFSVRAKTDWLPSWMFIPVVGLHGMILFGLLQMGSFRKTERSWRRVLDRTCLLGLIDLGLAPFLFWSNRVTDQDYFYVAVLLLGASSLLFLFNLNYCLEKLGAMLPDETLRQETKQFTGINRGLLLALLLITVGYFFCLHVPYLPISIRLTALLLEKYSLLALVFLVLLPLAMTMALIWKTKEVILNSVFSGHHLDHSELSEER